MKLPIQYRVSGPFAGLLAQKRVLLIMKSLISQRASELAFIMRADYVVVSPNRRAYTYVGLRIHWKGAHAQP